jgi:hypothetical protein
MGQQISIEDALAAFRKRYGEVADENVLLRAHVSILEQRVAALEEENAGFLSAAQGPAASDSDPAPADGYDARKRS